MIHLISSRASLISNCLSSSTQLLQTAALLLSAAVHPYGRLLHRETVLYSQSLPEQLDNYTQFSIWWDALCISTERAEILVYGTEIACMPELIVCQIIFLPKHIDPYTKVAIMCTLYVNFAPLAERSATPPSLAFVKSLHFPSSSRHCHAVDHTQITRLHDWTETLPFSSAPTEHPEPK